MVRFKRDVVGKSRFECSGSRRTLGGGGGKTNCTRLSSCDRQRARRPACGGYRALRASKHGVYTPLRSRWNGDIIGAMKTILKKTMSAVALAGLLATAGVACGQSSTTTTTSTTESAGTVSTIDPSAITIQSTTSMAPTSYSYSKTTTYVDQNGNPVSVETVKSGLPVTVYYTKDGDRMIASKVVVQRTSMPDAPGATSVETKKTTTTTTTPAQ